MAASAVSETEQPLLRRKGLIPSSTKLPSRYRNGGTVAPPPPPPPPIDLNLISSPSPRSYTSLRDILPSSSAAVNSPTAASAANCGYEISIRNRLVKQAAWAYLQPMSASSYSANPNFLHRFWLRFPSGNPFSNCIRFIRTSFIPSIVRFFRSCICL